MNDLLKCTKSTTVSRLPDIMGTKVCSDTSILMLKSEIGHVLPSKELLVHTNYVNTQTLAYITQHIRMLGFLSFESDQNNQLFQIISNNQNRTSVVYGKSVKIRVDTWGL